MRHDSLVCDFRCPDTAVTFPVTTWVTSQSANPRRRGNRKYFSHLTNQSIKPAKNISRKCQCSDCGDYYVLILEKDFYLVKKKKYCDQLVLNIIAFFLY